jgi:hypothetical protein
MLMNNTIFQKTILSHYQTTPNLIKSSQKYLILKLIGYSATSQTTTLTISQGRFLITPNSETLFKLINISETDLIFSHSIKRSLSLMNSSTHQETFFIHLNMKSYLLINYLNLTFENSRPQ